MEYLKTLNKICVMGDSILKAVVFNEGTGKYGFLKEEGAVYAFERSHPVHVENFAKFGCTVTKGCQRLEQVLQKGTDAQAVLLEFGGNDCDYDWDAVSEDPKGVHQPNTPYAVFVKTLDKMIHMVLTAGKRPFLMNLPPIDHKRYFQWISKRDPGRGERLMEFLREESIIYRHQEYYSRALEQAAARHGLYLVNVRDSFLPLKDYGRYLCVDGIHPNEKGQMLIQEAFSKAYSSIFPQGRRRKQTGMAGA